jgi:dihydrofolate reductase
MRTILIFVATLDGKITRWGRPFVKKWSSEEDHIYFDKIWDESPVTVMGSGTYDADPIKPAPGHHLIIMTKNPETYRDREVTGQLEFTSQSPEQVVARYENEGVGSMLVVGGPHLATSFLKANLIDELWLTIEPKIFGTGGNFVIHENLDIDLQLLSIEKANTRGTLFTKYAVIKQ